VPPEATADQTRRAQRRVRRRRRKARAALAKLGRSRGGLTSTIHLAAETGCRPLCFVTAGQAGDSPQFTTVLDQLTINRPASLRPRTRPAAVAADKANSSRANRTYLRRRSITAVIPIKDDQAAVRRKKGSRGGRPPSFNADLYKQRNCVERCINPLKTWRGIATRYDKRPDSYLAALHLRGAMLCLRT
jgi:transposase